MDTPHNAIMRFATAPDRGELLQLWKLAASAAVEYLREHAANGEQLFLAADELDQWIVSTIDKMPGGWRRDSMERMRQAIVAAVFQSLQREFLPEKFAPILDAQIPALLNIVTGDTGGLTDYIAADKVLRAAVADEIAQRDKPSRAGRKSGEVRCMRAENDADRIAKSWRKLLKKYSRRKKSFVLAQVMADCKCGRTKALQHKPKTI